MELSFTALVMVSVALVLGVVGSGLLHALNAALEQLPHSRERALAESRRPDGRRTIVAWLTHDVDKTANSTSVAYAIAEAVAAVSLTLIAVQMGSALELPWLWTALGALAAVAFLALVVERAVPRQIGRARPEATVRVAGVLAAPLIAATAPVRTMIPALRKAPLAEASDLVAQAQETLEEEDAELLESVVELGDRLTRELMVPRTDMITIASGTQMRRAMRLFIRSGFSRIPVVGESTDDLLGVVYLKDVLAHTWGLGEGRLEEPVDACMREPLFVPESVPADDLLRILQTGESHVAIVVDEFGGVAGLVTIEDALEEIVGELHDEHDVAAAEAKAHEDGGYLVPARMDLEEFGELLGVEIDDEEVETVAGLLTKAAGRVPIEGASATAHGIVLTAHKVAGRRKALAWILAEHEGAQSSHTSRKKKS